MAGVNDNERAGEYTWGNGGYWDDGTKSIFPDWVQINFNGTQTIDRIVVYTVQDNAANPVEPTDTLTFTQWGVTDFTVQGWDGSAWVHPGQRQRQQPGQAQRRFRRVHHRPHPGQRNQCAGLIFPHHRDRGLERAAQLGAEHDHADEFGQSGDRRCR